MLPTFHESQLPPWLLQAFRIAQQLAEKGGEIARYTKTTSPKYIFFGLF